MAKNNYNWLPDFIYGGIDGAVTTFAVVAGVEGADLAVPVIIILGFANLFADGFSMAVGKYLSDKAEREQMMKIYNLEMALLKTDAAGQTLKVQEVFENDYGFSGAAAKVATGEIVKKPRGWIDFLMKNKLNISHESIDPLKGGLATLGSFILIGFIPLVAYVFKPILNLSESSAFLLTCSATLFALFIVGTIKSRFIEKNWVISGFEVMMIGGIAATIAYFVGYFLKGFVAA